MEQTAEVELVAEVEEAEAAEAAGRRAGRGPSWRGRRHGRIFGTALSRGWPAEAHLVNPPKCSGHEGGFRRFCRFRRWGLSALRARVQRVTTWRDSPKGLPP